MSYHYTELHKNKIDEFLASCFEGDYYIHIRIDVTHKSSLNNLFVLRARCLVIKNLHSKTKIICSGPAASSAWR